MKHSFPIIFIVMVTANWFFVRSDQLQIIGLLFDIIGVYFLSQGLITKSLTDIVHESGGDEDKPYLGTPKDNYRVSLYIQSIEAKTGFILLLIGFTLQGFAYLFKNFVIPYHIGTFSLLISLLITVISHRKLFGYQKILKRVKVTETEIDYEIWGEIYEEQEGNDESNNT